MKKEKISEILDGIDEKYIAEASKVKSTRRSLWMKAGAAAACLALAVTAALALIPAMSSNEAGVYTKKETVTEAVIEHTDDTAATSHEDTEQAETKPPELLPPIRPYKDNFVSSSENAIIWPWENMTDAERYLSFTMNGAEYSTRARNIAGDKLGSPLGEFEFTGYDIYTDSTYKKSFNIYAIAGVSAEYLVAAEIDGEYTVFINRNVPLPATFGGLMDAYDLSNSLPLKAYTEHNDYDGGGYFTLDSGDEIWSILKECKDAPLQAEDTVVFSGREILSFTATSEELGIYKKVFSITRDGYVATNITEYGSVFLIGSDAAEKVFALAEAYGKPAEAEPYLYTVAGIVTEIGKGYVLLDDSSLCENAADGLIFKLDTTDMTMSRYFDHGIIREGTLITVSHTGELIQGEVCLITEPSYISEAVLTEDGVLTLE